MALGRLAWVVLFAIGLSAQPQQTATTPQGYRIVGVVVNSLNGQPVTGASVAIARTTPQGTNREVSQTVTTGADGRFAFAGLARSKYSLMATARGFAMQFFEHHDAYATAIAVGPDLDSEHLVFRLDPDASIEGQVTDDHNDPIQNATVQLFGRRIQDGQQKTFLMNEAQTDDQGQFRLGHLRPGTYYLAVSARPWYAQNSRIAPNRSATDPDENARAAQEAAALDVTYPLTFYPASPDSAGAAPIVLQPGERATADVVMRAVPAAHLRIRTGSAGSASGTTVSNRRFLGPISPRVSQRIFDGYLDSVFNAPVFSSEPGLVEISGLAPGHYVLEMSASGGLNNKTGTRSWYQEIDLAGDAELNASDAPAFATVSGAVTFDGATRVPKDSFLQLSNPATGDNFTGAISDKGQVDFNGDGVRPGRYTVLLENAHGFFLSKLSASGARLIGRTLEISGASSVHIVCVATSGVGQVDGVALRDGQPFAGAMVVLVPHDSANNLPLFRRDQSDGDGTFTLPNVVPGQYTVLAIANGWDLEWGNPAALQPYLKGGEMVQVTGEGKLQIKAQVQ